MEYPPIPDDITGVGQRRTDKGEIITYGVRNLQSVVLCYRCDRWLPDTTGNWYYSRTNDKTLVCSSCNTMEAIEANTRLGVRPQSQWAWPLTDAR